MRLESKLLDDAQDRLNLGLVASDFITINIWVLYPYLTTEVERKNLLMNCKQSIYRNLNRHSGLHSSGTAMPSVASALVSCFRAMSAAAINTRLPGRILLGQNAMPVIEEIESTRQIESVLGEIGGPSSCGDLSDYFIKSLRQHYQ
jgi:hypothetical protein